MANLPQLRGLASNRVRAERLRTNAIKRFPPLEELIRDNTELHWIDWWIQVEPKDLRSWKFWKDVADNTKNKKRLASKIEKEMPTYISKEAKEARKQAAQAEQKKLNEEIAAIRERWSNLTPVERDWDEDPYDPDSLYSNMWGKF